MDEYIKKSDLKAELLRRDFYPAIVKSALETIPPADVVPRAEVDHARLRGYENGIRSGAREVFKEIDELIKDYVNNHLDTAVLVVKLYLLKKKYTESENKQKDFFSPEEVRAMSRKEVRENYTAIMNSIKKW